MPTVIVIDVSLSMSEPVELPETGEVVSKQFLAIQGINTLLDYLTVNCKLEYVSVIVFSSLYERVAPFTRDFESIKEKIQHLGEFSRTSIETALHGVNRLVLGEWGNSTPCQVVLVTDGNRGIGPLSLKDSLSTAGQRDTSAPFPLPFSFPGKLSLMCVASADEPDFQLTLPLYRRLAELAGMDSAVHFPDGPLCPKSIHDMFQKLAESNFTAFVGTLKCGNLSSRVILSPSPQCVRRYCTLKIHRRLHITLHPALITSQPYHKETDFEHIKRSISNSIEICGFLDVASIGSPMAVSRHLVLPHPTTKTEAVSADIKMDVDSEDESGVDEGKAASFCVLLHGALKVENMAALCLLSDDWFGVIYSWADNKKKSNLMLTVLEPGADAVPWLGDLNRLGSLEDLPNGLGDDLVPSFPVRPVEKRSYSQNCVVWIRQAGLQSDMQKILRHARKLPDKTQQFYKELNRVRRAAISFGFIELLDGMAAIFERECTLLPGAAHPDCALQLTHAASVLRKPYSRDIKYSIAPLRTKFVSGE